MADPQIDCSMDEMILRIKELELENAYLKGKVEVLESLESDVSRIKEVSEDIYVYKPVIEYAIPTIKTIYGMLPAYIQNKFLEPNFYEENPKMLESCNQQVKCGHMVKS